MLTHKLCVDVACQVNEIPGILPEGFEFTIIEENGPGGGWPFIEVRANTKEELKEWYCVLFCGSTIKIEGDEFEEFYNQVN